MSVKHNFKDKDVVWVRLRRNLWWPGEVCDESRLPDGLISTLKTKPILVVSFFSEDNFEYVKNLSNICNYDDPRKVKFIKTGLDIKRSNSYQLENFSEDVKKAETLTNGDPHILESEEFLSASQMKQTLENSLDEETPIKNRKKSTTPKSSNSKRSKITTSATRTKMDKPSRISNDSYGEHIQYTPSSNKSSEHEFRILAQPKSTPEVKMSLDEIIFKCHFCDYNTKRYNLLKYHFMGHRNGSITAATTNQSINNTTSSSNSKPASPPTIETKAEPVAVSLSISPIKKRRTQNEILDLPINITDIETIDIPKSRNKRKFEEEIIVESEIKAIEILPKKAKAETEPESTKLKLLADWSEDENEPDIINISGNDLFVENTKTSPVKNNIQSNDTIENDTNEKKSNEQQTNNTTTVTKYRNIPKKDRGREFVFEDTPPDPNSETKQDNVKGNVSIAENEKEDSCTDIETKETTPVLLKNKNEYINIKKDIIKTRNLSCELNLSSETPYKDISVSVPLEEDKFDNDEQVENVIDETVNEKNDPNLGNKELLKVENIDECSINSNQVLSNSSISSPPLKQPIYNTITSPQNRKSSDNESSLAFTSPITLQSPINVNLQSPSAGQSPQSVSAPHISPSITTPPSKTIPKPSEISCFDFQDDEDLEIARSPPRRPQRQRKSILSSEKEKLENELKDKEIELEIENLLKVASLPKLPELPQDNRLSAGESCVEEASPKVNDENKIDILEQKDRALPPKERGKRIFKSRNRSKFSIENEVDLIIKKDVLDLQLDSGKSTTSVPTESDLQIAETLINIPAIIPQIKSPEQIIIIPVENSVAQNESSFQKKLDESSENKSEESNQTNSNNGSRIHVPRKKHLQAAFKAEEEKVKMDISGDSIATHSTVLLKSIEQPSLSPKQKFVMKLKEDVFAQKFEPRTPKKRKPTLEDENKSLTVENIASNDNQTIEILDAEENKIANTIDDSVFDINNMEIVLSDNLENVPFLVASGNESVMSPTVAVEQKTNEKFDEKDNQILENTESKATIMPKSRRSKGRHGSSRHKKFIQENNLEPDTNIINTVSTESIMIIEPTTELNAKIEKESVGRRKKKNSQTLTDNDSSSNEPKYTIVSKKSAENDNKIIIKKTIEKFSESGKANILSSETLPASSSESIILTKSQFVQAGSGGQIVITSKGQLLTTDTSTVVSSKSSTHLTDCISSAMVSVASNVSMKAPSKVQVQSQKFIYPEEPEKRKMIKITKNKGKANMHEKYVRMSPKKLAEMSKLGLIKNQGQDKVIKSSAFKKFTQEQSKRKLQKSVEKKRSTFPNSENINNEIQDSNKLTEPSTSEVVASPKYMPTEECETDFVPSGTEEEKVETEAMLEPEIDSPPIVAPQSGEITENYYALPAENYGGPPNSFYLCRRTGHIDDNNQFAPIDDRALYLDSTNRLVERIAEPPTSQNTNEHILEQSQINDTITDLNQLQELPAQSFIINTGDGQQIVVDQQSLLSIAAGEMPHLITADGQQIIIQGSPQDIITALAVNQAEMNIITGDQQIIIPQGMDESHSNNSDILAVALEATDVYPSSESIIGNVLIQNQTHSDIICDQTVPTATVLSKPPIMSTLEAPTNKAINETTHNLTLESGLNIDDSLAVIGVSTTNSNVPSSLELPITVTNPAIASKTSPLTLNTIYTPPISSIGALSHISQISPSLGYDLFDTSSSITSAKISIQEHKSNNLPVTTVSQFSSNIPEQLLTRDDENQNSNDNEQDSIIPQSPEVDISQTSNDIRMPSFEQDDGNSSDHSDEIPIQPNLVLQSSNFINSDNNYENQNNNLNDSNHENMIIINGNFIKIDNIADQSDDER